MTKRSAVHDTFTIERTYPETPERAYQAFADPKAKPHTFDCTYLDIVPNERFVYSYVMHIGAHNISASLATIEIAPAGKGTKLKMTEQGVFLDGYDDSGSREKGTHGLLDQLGKALSDA